KRWEIENKIGYAHYLNAMKFKNQWIADPADKKSKEKYESELNEAKEIFDDKLWHVDDKNPKYYHLTTLNGLGYTYLEISEKNHSKKDWKSAIKFYERSLEASRILLNPPDKQIDE